MEEEVSRRKDEGVLKVSRRKYERGLKGWFVQRRGGG
jgi:hypothetical protein